jgi:hypothetical protein
MKSLTIDGKHICWYSDDYDSIYVSFDDKNQLRNVDDTIKLQPELSEFLFGKVLYALVVKQYYVYQDDNCVHFFNLKDTNAIEKSNTKLRNVMKKVPCLFTVPLNKMYILANIFLVAPFKIKIYSGKPSASDLLYVYDDQKFVHGSGKSQYFNPYLSKEYYEYEHNYTKDILLFKNQLHYRHKDCKIICKGQPNTEHFKPMTRKKHFKPVHKDCSIDFIQYKKSRCTYNKMSSSGAWGFDTWFYNPFSIRAIQDKYVHFTPKHSFFAVTQVPDWNK